MYTPTKERIEELKSKHGDLFLLKVEDKACLVKRPSRKAISYAASIGTKDPLKFNEILLNECFIEGDPEIKTDDSYFLGASNKLAVLIESRQAELEKL
jgi:hypothetical protein